MFLEVLSTDMKRRELGKLFEKLGLGNEAPGGPPRPVSETSKATFIPKLLKKVRAMLSNLDERYELQVTNKPFKLPAEFGNLETAQKRNLMVCNLFVNERRSIGNIADVLNMSVSSIVSILIQRGYIEERRRRPTTPLKDGKRQEDLREGAE
jgi:hypothetical protein